MARARAELVANLRAFAALPDRAAAGSRAADLGAAGAAARYRAAVELAERGAELSAVCAQLDWFERILHGRREAAEREREEQRA